jgi:hypothetical protein
MTVASNEKEIQMLKEIVKKLSAILVGNGVKGMDEVVRDIEKRMGVVESELKHLRRVFFESEGLDAMGNPPKKEESKGDAERFVDWFKDKVLPGLIQTLITFVVSAGFVLMVLHWTDVIK